MQLYDGYRLFEFIDTNTRIRMPKTIRAAGAETWSTTTVGTATREKKQITFG